MPPVCTKVGVKRKSLPGAPKFYVFQESNSVCVFCSLSSEFFFAGDFFHRIILKRQI